MKPCRRNRKLIVWLAMDALSDPAAEELRAHLRICEPCRRYLDEISVVKQRLESISAPVGSRALSLGAPASRRRVPLSKRARRDAHSDSPLNWRLALPALCAIALAMLVSSVLMRHPIPPASPPGQTKAISTPRFPADLPPTLANYRAIANQSLDSLDQLLTSQARKPVPAPAPFTAATLALVNAGD